MGRQYGRSKRGQCVYLPEPGRKYKRINIVAGQRNGETIGLRTYTWAMTAAFFEIWFEWELCPLLKRGSIIVMDNASFHRKKALEKITPFHRESHTNFARCGLKINLNEIVD